MIVEVDPGTGTEHIEDGDNFPLAQTEPNTNLDAFLATLDADTRQYIQLLVAGGAAGDRRPRRAALQRLPPLPALRPLHRRTSTGRSPQRHVALAERDPQLRAADHRTRPPRRRDQALRHLLRRRARQLRQRAGRRSRNRCVEFPAALRAGQRRPRQLQPLLPRRPPGADRADPAGAGARARPSRPPSASSTRRPARSATRSGPSPARSARC